MLVGLGVCECDPVSPSRCFNYYFSSSPDVSHSQLNFPPSIIRCSFYEQPLLITLVGLVMLTWLVARWLACCLAKGIAE